MLTHGGRLLKHGCSILVLGLLFAAATPAHAQVFCNFFSVLKRDFVRNNSWPEPFVQPDRESVNLPQDIMVAKGWQRSTLVCDAQFNDDSTKLNGAGEEQVRWILTNVPAQHRVIYVQRGVNDAITASRIKAIQVASRGLVPRGQVVEIVQTNMTGDGFSADRVDATYRKSMANIPDPKLPKGDSGDSNGAGGGGSN